IVGDVGADLLHCVDHVLAGLGDELLAIDGHCDEAGVLGRGLAAGSGWRRRRLGRGWVGLLSVARAHCSTSPPIMLMVSNVGIRSASILPSIIRGTPERIAKPGARTWTLYGRPDPSLTRYQPSSPFAASVES